MTARAPCGANSLYSLCDWKVLKDYLSNTHNVCYDYTGKKIIKLPLYSFDNLTTMQW